MASLSPHYYYSMTLMEMMMSLNLLCLLLVIPLIAHLWLLLHFPILRSMVLLILLTCSPHSILLLSPLLCLYSILLNLHSPLSILILLMMILPPIKMVIGQSLHLGLKSLLSCLKTILMMLMILLESVLLLESLSHLKMMLPYENLHLNLLADYY